MSHETETETVTELDNLTANTSVFFEIVLFKKKSISMNMQGTFMEIFFIGPKRTDFLALMIMECGIIFFLCYFVSINRDANQLHSNKNIYSIAV